MKQLFLRYLDICLFRSSPEDLPSSSFLMTVTMAMYAAMDLILAIIKQLPFFKGLILVGFDICLVAAILYLILWIRLLTDRFTQAFTALIGCGLIVQIMALPLIIMQTNFSQQAAEASMDLSIVVLLSLAVLVWHILITAHILRHTLSTIMPVGIALSILFFFITYSVTASFLPVLNL